MSQAPVEASEYRGAAKAYVEATMELNRQVDAGTSWSGNERNNLFLNLGKEGAVPDFADASALMGFDFPDDSRGLVSLDWDFDGDLDFITTNRTAPRVRIFENRAVSRMDSFVSLKLAGKGINRDAIGSRVELKFETEEGDESLLVRRLHAGQGFISQSSRWLHFGIPEGAKIVQVVVKWQGEKGIAPEDFAGIDPGRFFILQKGTGRARLWSAPETKIPKMHREPVKPERSATLTAHLERPVPLPAIPYLDLNEKPREIGSKLERPMVLNLWATWCAPCLTELRGIAQDAELIRDAGVDVLALCVDVAPDDGTAAMDKARGILTKTGYPFDAGFAAEKTVELLHIVHNTVFVRPDKLPVPTTLLIGTSGRVASVHRGLIEVADLLPVISAMKGTKQQWEEFASGFDGRWIHGPDTVFYVGVAKELLDRDWEAEAERFVLEHRDSLEADGKKYAEILMLMGTRLLERKEVVRGLSLLELAVDVAPDLPVARNNLAVALLQAKRSSDAVPHLQAAIALNPEFADPAVNLARVHVSNKQFVEAMELLDRVLAQAYHPGAMRLKAQVLLAENKPKDVLAAFQKIVENEPNQPVAWLNLGKLQFQLGDAGAASESFKRGQLLAPENLEIQQWIDRLESRPEPNGTK